jgi:sensor domain CHASE-containing protein
MGIRSKVAIALSVCILCLTGVLHVVMSVEFRRIVGNIERLQMVEDVQRVRLTLQQEQDGLSTTVEDWAKWDDTYRFIQDRNAGYIHQNLPPATLQSLGIDGMLFLNSSGKLVYSASAGRSDPALGVDSIVRAVADCVFEWDGGPHAWLLEIADRLLLMAACQIVDSMEALPARGTLVFYRIVNEELVKELGKRVQRSLSFLPFKAASLPVGAGTLDDLGDESSLLLLPLSTDRIVGFAALLGVHGDPVFLVRIEGARSFRRSVWATQITFATGYVIASVIITLVIFLLLATLVLRPILRIDREVREIGRSTRFSGRLTESGKDEFYRLSHAVNAMLEELDAANRKLLTALEEVRTLGGLLPICASCKRIRDDAGYWQQVEVYLSEHSEVTFTHGLCPDCLRKFSLEFDLNPDQIGGAEKPG